MREFACSEIPVKIDIKRKNKAKTDLVQGIVNVLRYGISGSRAQYLSQIDWGILTERFSYMHSSHC